MKYVFRTRLRIITCAALVFLCGCQVIDQLEDLPSQLMPNTVTAPVEIPAWTAIDLRAARTVAGHTARPLAIQLINSPVSQVISVGSDGSLVGWDLASGEAHKLPSVHSEKPLNFAAFGESHSLVAYSTDDQVVVECVSGCASRWVLNKIKTRIKAIAFHAEDSSVLIGAIDSRVYRWKFIAEGQATSVREKEKCFERYAAHQSVVSAIASHPFGRAFFSGDWTGSIFGWLTYDSDDYAGAYDKNLFSGRFYGAPGTFTKAVRIADRGISDLAVSANGERLVVGAQDGFVEVWHVKGLEKFARAQIHQGPVLSVAISPSTRHIATVGRDGYVRINNEVEDSSFGISPSAFRDKFVELSAYQLPTARFVRFITEERLVAATNDGALVELNIRDNPTVATPIPTPSPTPGFGTDTDY